MAKVAKKIRSAPRRSNAVRLQEEKHVGRETTEWADVPKDKLFINILDTLRHYGYFYDKKHYVEWTTVWMKENRPEDLKYYKSAEDWRTSSTVAALCRMEMNGCVLPEQNKAFQTNAIDEIVSYGKSIKVVIDPDSPEPVKRKSPSELLGEKTSEFIGEIEGCIDDYTLGTLDKQWSIYDIMIKEGSAAQTAHDTIRHYKSVQEELRELVEDKTEDLVEGYSHMTPRKQKAFYKFICDLISDTEKFLLSKKATRKTRVKKPTPALKQVSKVLYLPSSSEYKIASVSPEKMVGADQLYLFNTKTRQMKYLVSDRRNGFEVKGSTIIGFDVKNSFKKMLRKPEDYIATLAKATKSKALKELRSLKTKESETDGRINRDTIILKVL